MGRRFPTILKPIIMGKTKKVKQTVDTMELGELIEICDNQLIDAVENKKFKRTSRSKRNADQVVSFFTNVTFYLKELKQLKSKDDE